MEIKTPLYSTISDKLGVTKPPLTEPVATTIPVAEASAPQPPVPSFTGTPLPKDSFASQLSDIEAQAKAIQGIVSERATTPVDPATGAPTPVPGATPTPTPEAVSPRDKILQNYLDLAGTDLSPQKEQMRQEAQLAQKEEQARNLGNRVIERDNWYRDKIEAVERNPDGKLRGAIEADVYELQKARSRELADLSFAYNVALGDFESAQNSVNERIKDMEADIQRDINILSTAYQFMGDDLTESEMLEIDQAFQERMAQKEQDYAKEMADYNDKLARGRMSYEASLKGAGETPVDETESALNTVSLMRDTISRILGDEEKGYDPLYEGAGANSVAEFFRKNIGSSATEFTRLTAYADTLKSNMLMLGADPNIRDFFGPQMSEADVRQMMASATRLDSKNLTPTEIKQEVQRIETFIGKYESAVRAKASGLPSNPNIIIAPDGVEIEIID